MLFEVIRRVFAPASGQKTVAKVMSILSLKRLEDRCLLAGIIDWTGGGTNSLWSNGDNWSGGHAPRAGDSVRFANANAKFATMDIAPTGPDLPYQIAGLVLQAGEINLTKPLSVDGRCMQTGGTIGGPGILSIEHSNPYVAFSFWNGGTMAGAGTTKVVDPDFIIDPGNAGVTLDTRTLLIAGEMPSVVEWLGGDIITKHGARIINQGRFEADSSGSIKPQSDTSGGTFINEGEFIKPLEHVDPQGHSRTLARTFTTIAVPFNNTNQVNIENGTLRLAGGGESGAAFFVGAGAEIYFGAKDADPYKWDGGTELLGAGMVYLIGSAKIAAGDEVDIDNLTINMIRSGNQELTGTGSLSINQSLNWLSGRVKISALNIGRDAQAMIDGNDLPIIADLFGPKSLLFETGSLKNEGLLTLKGSTPFQVGRSGRIDNAGKFVVQAATVSEAPLGGTGSPVLANSGTVEATRGAATIGINVSNTGTVLVDTAGVLTVTGQFGQGAGETRLDFLGKIKLENVEVPGLAMAGGKLTGDGTIYGDVLNSGCLVDLSSKGRPSLITINGSYIETGGAVGIRLQINGLAPGRGFGKLWVRDSADFNSKIEIVTSPGFNPNVDDEYKVISYGRLERQNSVIVLPALGAGKELSGPFHK